MTEAWTPKEKILLEQQVVTRPIVRDRPWTRALGWALVGAAVGWWVSAWAHGALSTGW